MGDNTLGHERKHMTTSDTLAADLAARYESTTTDLAKRFTPHVTLLIQQLVENIEPKPQQPFERLVCLAGISRAFGVAVAMAFSAVGEKPLKKAELSKD